MILSPSLALIAVSGWVAGQAEAGRGETMVKQTCIYCGSNRNVEDEHIRAASKGGKRTEPACCACNRSKGDKALKEWLRWVKKNDKYRWDRQSTVDIHKLSDIA